MCWSRSTIRPSSQPLLTDALARAKTSEQAGALGNLARVDSSPEGQLQEVDVAFAPSSASVSRQYAAAKSYNLTPVYEASLARQAELSTDPVAEAAVSVRPGRPV